MKMARWNSSINRRSLVVAFCAVLLIVGMMFVTRTERAPEIGKPIRIVAKLYADDDLEVPGIDAVEVPLEDWDMFSLLIKPVKLYPYTVSDQQKPHVADVLLHYPAGKITRLEVREAGHNPAIVSVNDGRYYYASADYKGDGAIRVMQLIREYHYRQKIAK